MENACITKKRQLGLNLLDQWIRKCNWAAEMHNLVIFFFKTKKFEIDIKGSKSKLNTRIETTETQNHITLF